MRVYGSRKHDLAPTKQGRALWMVTKKAANWAQRHIDPARPWLLHKAGFADVALLIRAEQSPNPDSRVTLGSQIDPLGVRRVNLDWRLSPPDKRSVAGLRLADRKTVVEGNSVSVRVDSGGRRIIKKKK